MIANISPFPIGQAYQSTSKGDPLPRHGRVSRVSRQFCAIGQTTALAYHKQQKCDMCNNATDIWAITLLTYGQQQKRDMCNNATGICAITLLAYHEQQKCDMCNNDIGISRTTVLAYAHYGIQRHRHTVLCFYAP